MKQGGYRYLYKATFLSTNRPSKSSERQSSCIVFLSFLSALKTFRHCGTVHDSLYTSITVIRKLYPCPAPVRVYYVVMLSIGY